MKLVRVVFHNFRCLTGDAVLRVDPEVTALVGPNESGKTAILKALHKLDVGEFEQEDICSFTKWGKKGQVPADAPMMTVVFKPSAEEREILAEIDAELKSADELPVRLDFGGGASIDAAVVVELSERRRARVDETLAEFRSSLEDLGQYLEELKARQGEAAPQVDATMGPIQQMISLLEQQEPSNIEGGWSALQASLESIPVSEAEDQERRDRAVGELASMTERVGAQIREAEPEDALYGLLPRFLFVDAELANLVPDEANLRELAERNDSEQRFDVVRRLLALGDVDVKDYFSLVPERRARVLNRASETITKTLQRVWSQERVRIHLDAEGDLLRIYVETPGGDYGFPSRRSRGFQWFLAFYVTYAFAASEGLENSVLLLDEPGIHLHPMGQKDLLVELREIGRSSQVIYTTHLPDMIDLENPERVRVVTKEPGPGSGIINEAWLPREEGIAFEVVMKALWGAVFAPSLTLGRTNLILEGPSDHAYILAVGRILAKEDAKYSSFVNGEVTLMPTKGVSHFGVMIRFCSRKGLQNVALFDSDQTGRRIKKQLIDEGVLTEQEAVEINDVFDDKTTDRDVEALVRLPLLKDAVLSAYGQELPADFSFQEKDLAKKGPLGTRVRDFMRDTVGLAEFDKLEVALKVKEILEAEPSRLPARARESFKQLFDVILGRFDRS